MQAANTVVFLPGTLCDARVFAPQIARFTAAGWRVRVPLIGAHAGGLPGLAADVLARLPARFALVGLSLGGVLAAEMIAQAPRRISHAALLDTGNGADDRAARARREADFAAAEAMGLENFMREVMLRRYLHPDNRGREPLARAVVDMALDAGADAWRAQAALLATRRDCSAALAAFEAPALIACGAADAVCSPAAHRAIAAVMPRARLQVFPACAHLPTLEAPEAVAQALAALVEE